MSSIPQEVEIDILLRLPVKSILRFKSICKNWYRLIRSPEFVKDHLSLANKNPKLMIRDLRSLLYEDMFYSVDYDSILSASASSLPLSAITCKSDRVVPMDDSATEYKKILGSCNGLLCFDTSDGDLLILWNPSTREYKKIIPPANNLELPSYGFGYDSKINDYKLVCIAQNQVYAYTLKSGLWRKVFNTIPCMYVGEPVGLLLNGALHWTLTTESRGITSKAIVAFDISREKFMRFPFPEELIQRLIGSICHLRMLGESLCLVCGIDNLVDVWFMQNYGVMESWTKKSSTKRIAAHPYALKCLYFINGDIILIQVLERFALYDLKNDRIRFLNINGLDKFYCYSESYVESIVSLNSGIYTERRLQIS